MENSEKQVSKYLLQSNAIKLNPTKPFTWASGWKSPIYCDNRLTLSFPNVRNFLKKQFVSICNTHYPAVECIAGVATGGIPQGALIADSLALPFVYVRSGSKGHGLGKQVEGVIKENQKVVVIEDLISTGKSSLHAVEALRALRADVIGMIAIFSYQFDIACNKFKEQNCPLHTLSNYTVLIEEASQTGYISEDDLDTLKAWRKNPEIWGQE
jgi:orotate phosphoribosyltransferase